MHDLAFPTAIYVVKNLYIYTRDPHRNPSTLRRENPESILVKRDAKQGAPSPFSDLYMEPLLRWLPYRRKRYGHCCSKDDMQPQTDLERLAI
jgi:hypothetical protein